MGLQMKAALDESSKEDKERWRKANRELHYVYKRSPLSFLVHNEKPNSVGAVQLSINKLDVCICTLLLLFFLLLFLT